MAKPTKLPEWASGGGADVQEPTAGEKLVGWEEDKSAPAKWMNWLQENTYDWLTWVDERVADGDTSDDTALVNPTGGAELLHVSAVDGLRLQGEAAFRFFFDGTDPFVYFDATDYLQYDRSANQYLFKIGGSDEAVLESGKLTLFGETDYQIYFDGVDPWLVFDTMDYLQYDRSTNEYLFRIGAATKLSLGSTDASFFGEADFRLSYDGTDPRLYFDTNDYVWFDRSTNTFDFRINGVQEMTLDNLYMGLAGWLGVGSTAVGPVNNIHELHQLNMAKAHCRADSSGALQAGSYNMISTTKTAPGTYLVTLGWGVFSGTPSVCVNGTGAGKAAMVVQLTSTTFTVTTFIASTGAASDQDFSFTLLGGS